MVNQTLKGFRDFLPKEAKKRQYVLDTLKKVFESYGFEPLETPALEYEEILLGKYGDEGDKLMYRFEDNGKRKVALRYDQTVPLARVVAQGQNELPMPFKRYQIQNVWRAENTQKGRYREFLQCDADIVGVSSPLADAEIIALANKSLETLGFKKYKIKVNDRKIFENIDLESIKILDKLGKIGPKKVEEELERINSKEILNKIENSKPLETTDVILKTLNNLGINQSNCEFFPTLARGLDYYTGMIFEIEIEGYSAGSVCGGGRYDNLIGMFAGKQIPAVGFAFGFDRLMEAMEDLNLFPKDLQTTKILVTVFSPELKEKSLQITTLLREKGINTEIYLEENVKMDKQLKYADKKQIPYAIIIGPDEVSKNMVTLKNMKTRNQKTVLQNEIEKLLAS
ncbi:MAG: histidine--tRNA ligase [Candidatus Levybacteria bacterium]|nr:histidine--tRNA ligase [Candidatus Levybacteria bacterium]